MEKPSLKKQDDCQLTPSQYQNVRQEAVRALAAASAIGRFPTPVADVMAIANIQEVDEDVLNEGFILKMRKKAGSALKSALSKVIGLFDVKAGLVFIDRTLHKVKQTFVRLHEAGHGFLSWQRDLYSVVEECAQTIDPDIADLFDREANVFATEVLFQLDGFINEAESGHGFDILTPVKLSKKYGASIYSSIRQYVSKNHRTCAVLVLNPPKLIQGDGFQAEFRRFIPSDEFKRIFGEMAWPEVFTPDDKIGAIIPIGRKMSGKRELTLKDRNGKETPCIAETFTQSWQVFVLICTVDSLEKPRIYIPD